jgi:acetyl-CoA carboxylase biotin carboxyl carrier protein
MRTTKILELVKMVEEHDIDEIELSRFGTRIKITKTGSKVISGPAEAQREIVRRDVPSAENNDKSLEAPQPMSANSVEVKSPMVGTYYAAPAPDADSFVKVGDQINKGQTLCIIEAMKVMNEIEAETAGTLVKILVENGEPVEFDQSLFIIET